MNERNTSLDLLRIIGALFVIMLHYNNSPFPNHPLLDSLYITMILSCNSIFFIMSGRFNLNREYKSKHDYATFYKKKFIGIIIPYIVGSLIIVAWNTNFCGGHIPGYLHKSANAILSDNIGTHLWFVFSLVCFLLASPFLSKMLCNMQDFELNSLFGISIGYSILTIYGFQNPGIPFSFNEWILSGWIFHYIMGYYILRIVNQKNKYKFYIAGVLGYAITVIGVCYFIKDFHHAHDLSAGFILFSMALVIFFDQEIKIKNEKLCKAIQFIAKDTFMVYILHWNFISFTAEYVPLKDSLLKFIVGTGMIFAISLIAAEIVNRVLVKPLQWIARKLLHV